MIASILHDMEWVVPLRSEFLTPVFKFFTILGFTEFFFAALPILFWSWNKRSGSRIAILTLVAGMLTLFFKDLFQDPRPPAEIAVPGTRPESYGLPSGHTLMAIVFWGSLAFEARKKWLYPLAIFLIIGISSSRLYLGVHDIEDVLVGAAIGFLLLGSLIFRQLRCPECCEGTVPLLLLFLLPILLLVSWPQNGTVGKMSLVSGFFIAWLIGIKVERVKLKFENPRSWKRWATGIAGFGILMLMAYTLRAFLVDVPLPSFAGPVIGGTLIGFGTTFLVPWFLLKLKLLQREKS